MVMTPEQLKRMVFPGESGGDYNALFGYANRPGGQFAGVNLTDMTVNQALQFSDPSGPYAQSVRGQIGRVATPMGAYQVVGTTLRDAAKGLGLTGNERMTPELQDQIGMWIYQNQGPGAWEAWGGGGSGSASSGKGGAMPMGLFDMQEEPQTFGQRLKRDFQSGELMDRIALAANTLRMDPDQNLAQMIQIRQEKRGEKDTANRTAQWLISQNRQDLAQALMTGAIDPKTAVATALQKKDAVNAVEVNGKLVNPETGEVLYDGGPDQKEAFGNEVELMKSYRADPAVQAYSSVSNYYGRMVSAYDETVKNPQAAGAGDLAMVYSYMKMLDPGSTVMQGEYASASNTSGVPDQIRNAYNNILNGSKLTEAQRLAFIQQAGGMLSSTATGLNAANEVYGSTASRFGVNPGFIIKPISPRTGGGNGSTTDVVTPPELPSLQVIPGRGF
jgi:hypothetical protein